MQMGPWASMGSSRGPKRPMVKTKYGWHIVKLLKQYPILSFDEMEKEISTKVRKSGRTKLSDNAVLNRLKSEYSIKIIASSKKVVLSKNSRNIPIDSLQNILLYNLPYQFF